MKVYTFNKTQFFNSNVEEVWKYISTPVNLSKITPREMNFQILSNTGSENETYPGQIIQYKVSILPFVRIRWVTEITHVKDREFFVDEQRFGPYAFWHHQHIIREKNGGVEMDDIVSYAIPFGFLGRIMNSIFISKQLNTIFDYRKGILDEKFNKGRVKTTEILTEAVL